jgi:anti-anti-sigma factor
LDPTPALSTRSWVRIPPDLELRIEHLGSGGVVVSILGELDALNAGAFRDAIAPLIGRPITFDITGLTFCAAAGLRCLLAAARPVGSCRVLGASPQLRRLIEIVGVQDVLIA